MGKKTQISENKNNNVEKYNENIGNCSVLWKLAKTPDHLKQNANELVKEYMYLFVNNKDNRKTHYKLEIFKIFYQWLYFENYDFDKEY